MLRYLSFLILAAAPLFAQPIGFGLKAGLPFNDALRLSSIPGPTQFISDTQHRGVIGPYLEIHLPAGLGIEADALYRSLEYRQSSAPIALGNSSISTWEFPVTLKVRFSEGVFRPYVEGGVVYGRITDVANIIDDLQHKSNFGIVAGGGLEVKLGFLRIAPGLRYNGWTVKSLQNPAGLLETSRSQFMFTVAFGF